MGHPHNLASSRKVRIAVNHQFRVRRTSEHEDRLAYVPEDITAEWYEPILVWHQFCAEANLRHAGTMTMPTLEEETLQ